MESLSSDGVACWLTNQVGLPQYGRGPAWTGVDGGTMLELVRAGLGFPQTSFYAKKKLFPDF